MGAYRVPDSHGTMGWGSEVSIAACLARHRGPGAANSVSPCLEAAAGAGTGNFCRHRDQLLQKWASFLTAVLFYRNCYFYRCDYFVEIQLGVLKNLSKTFELRFVSS